VTTPSAPEDTLAPLRAALAGRYEIEREIGQGAFATVYLAHDARHERQVALKVLNADPTSQAGEIRFIREIRMLARLQHPNILPLHDSGHVEALLYYVMPYVSGESLRARMSRERQLPIEVAARIGCEVVTQSWPISGSRAPSTLPVFNSSPDPEWVDPVLQRT
jgi:serine/threonine-protein kinase